MFPIFLSNTDQAVYTPLWMNLYPRKLIDARPVRHFVSFSALCYDWLYI